ncbi:hypothetical protein LIA77_09585 [Sarocladium implicatum]|nr:hypothetical protein LIA77_09585 [Sarocladium implicatum]
MSSAPTRTPSWLFTNNVSNPKTAIDSEPMAKKSLSAPKAASNGSAVPPPELLALVESFLERNAYKKALEAFNKQLGAKKTTATSTTATLEELFASWKSAQPQAKSTKTKDESSDSDSDSGSESSSSDESSSSSSDSDDDDTDMEDAPKTASPAAGKQPLSLKRKAPSESASSSDSDSSSESSSSDSESSDDEPKAKKQKVAPTKTTKKEVALKKAAKPAESSDSDSDSSSESSSDSDDSSDSEDEKPAPTKTTSKDKKDASSSSDSSSSDDSSDDSSSESEAEVAAVAAQVPLPGSDSDDSSSDDSSSDSDAPAAKKQSAIKDASDSSVTVDNPPLPPNPTAAQRKKANIPFSRIPKDIYVDPKFASNAYVPMSYSQRAHEDLIITKGKGFTKEKNKKKKGSFRGGAIDITEKKGIYFD